MKHIIAFFILLAACGDTYNTTSSTRSVCSGGSCVTQALIFLNPYFAENMNGGGGIFGDTQPLPSGVTHFSLRIDGGLVLITNDPPDSAYYNLRIATIVVVHFVDESNYTIYGANASGEYDVPEGEDITLYPLWQSVVDTPANRDLPANAIGQEVDVIY